MKKKNIIKVIIIVIILLLLAFGLYYVKKNNWFIKNNNDEKKDKIIETMEDDQKEEEISQNMDVNKYDKKTSKKELDNMNKNNNKFNDNNFEKDDVDRRFEIRLINPDEFPISHDGGIIDEQKDNQKDNQNKQGISSDYGQMDKPNNSKRPEKSINSEKINTQNMDKTNTPKSNNSKQTSKQKKDKIDIPKQADNSKPAENSGNEIIEQEDIKKEELEKILTIFTKNYRAGLGLVFNSKNNNELPDEAFVGIKTTGENDGKFHKISWSGDDLDDIKANKPGEYQLKVDVNDIVKIQEKDYTDISFYINIVIR